MHFVWILLMLLLGGCAPERPSTNWAAIGLPGKSLELIDDNQVEYFIFRDDGQAGATLGFKDGPQAAPILLWKMDGEFLVIYAGLEPETYRQDLQAIAVNGDIVSVRTRSGKKKNYRLAQP